MSTTEAPTKRKCAATKRNGEPCGAAPITNTELCAGHSGRGIAADPERYSRIGGEASAQARSNRAETRKMGFTDALAAKLHRDADTLAERWITEGKQDWRATEGALTRLYGKPKETVELTGGLDLTAMSQADRDELIRRALAESPAVLEALPEPYRAKLALMAGGL